MLPDDGNCHGKCLMVIAVYGCGSAATLLFFPIAWGWECLLIGVTSLMVFIVLASVKYRRKVAEDNDIAQALDEEYKNLTLNYLTEIRNPLY